MISGTMMNQNGAQKNGKKKRRDLGDILGRSKEGFQRLKTEDDDEVDQNVTSDSEDDLEDFAVPALRA